MNTVNQWKDRLVKERALKVHVATAGLAPRLQEGDEVTITAVPLAEIKRGDIVLCAVQNQVRLRTVARVKEFYSMPCIEVHDRDTGIQYVAEAQLVGKVTGIRRIPQKSMGTVFGHIESMLRKLQGRLTKE